MKQMIGKNCMHVVIVDEELPYPTNSGKRLRVFNLLRHLAQWHRITLICHRNRDPSEQRDAEQHVRSLGVETRVVTPQGFARFAHAGGLAVPIKLAVNSMSRLPYSVQWHRCPRLSQAIKQYDESNQVDLWQCEWVPYATHFLRTGVRPWVLMAHDIQTLIWQRHLHAEENAFKRLLIGKQLARYRRFEHSVMTSADLTMTVTPQDAERAATDFGARKTAVVENGVDVNGYQSSAPVSGHSQRDRYQILFVGNLQWRPNLDAARLLLEEVLPRVRLAESKARLVLVGRQPPAWLRKQCSSAPGVTLCADVPDVRGFFYRCGLLAVPLRFASGSRLKILEALVTGTPVISSGVGAEGLRLVPGEHFVRADDPDAMSRAIIHWIRHPQEADAMARAGQRLVEQEYDWEVLAQRMQQAWLEVVRPPKIQRPNDSPLCTSVEQQ